MTRQTTMSMGQRVRVIAVLGCASAMAGGGFPSPHAFIARGSEVEPSSSARDATNENPPREQQTFQAQPESDNPSVEEMDRRVSRFIEELGSDQYVRRERAQAELEQLGVMAFDALREAQVHDDIEIALRARYLVRRLQVRWIDERDPPEVRRVLRDYGEQGVAERRSRIDRLAALDDSQGLSPLCRLVRFESELRLAKHAALLLLRHSPPANAEEAAVRSQSLIDGMSLSRNPAASWVKTYAKSLMDPADTDALWDEVLADEKQTLIEFPERTSPEIVIDLVRWRAEELFSRERRDKAIPLALASLDLVPSKREQLISAVDWLIRYEVWEGVDQLAERDVDIFTDSIPLRYRVAEVHLRRGETDEAEATALSALQHRAENFEERLEAAIALQERGLFPWAEREFRHVMETAQVGSNQELDARFSLAEMLHDQMEDLAAAKVFQEVVDRMKSDPDYAKRVREHRRGDPDVILARMHFFYAEHYAHEDREKQRENLELGLEAYPREIDLLIAGYRFPDGDEEWKAKIRQNLADAVGTYREQIRQYSDTLQRISGHAQENDLRRYVAVLNNQFAWLVANTEGDFEEALRCSRLSLEHVPNSAGYLDTLGRCYYAMQDYRNAVKYQSRAVALEPHSGQIRRQLHLFEEALAAEVQ